MYFYGLPYRVARENRKKITGLVLALYGLFCMFIHGLFQTIRFIPCIPLLNVHVLSTFCASNLSSGSLQCNGTQRYITSFNSVSSPPTSIYCMPVVYVAFSTHINNGLS